MGPHSLLMWRLHDEIHSVTASMQGKCQIEVGIRLSNGACPESVNVPFSLKRERPLTFTSLLVRMIAQLV
jgi:hypothetical protein